LVAVPSTGRATNVVPHRGAPEADATRELYERYARQIYAYCFHQLGNKEEAEDATQSTFLNAFRGFKRGVDPEFETAWLYKIAQNVCLTRRRSSSRRRRIETPGDLEAMQDFVPAHQVDPDELIGLPEALDAMPEQQRRALLMREWQGLSYKEIGEELDLSQAAVETLLFRARRSLAAGLSEDSPNVVGKRLRAGGDAGSALALVKSLLLTGGAKVAATVVTVAATSAVVASPAVRHAVVPQPPVAKAAAPLVSANAPVSTAVSAVPVSFVHPVAVVRAAPAPHHVRPHVRVATVAPRRVAARPRVETAAPVSVPTTRAPAVVVEPPVEAPVPAPAAAPAVSPAAHTVAPPVAEAPGQAKKNSDRGPSVAPAAIEPVVQSHGAAHAAAPLLPPGREKKSDPPATSIDPPVPTPDVSAVPAVEPAAAPPESPGVSNGNGRGNGGPADDNPGHGHGK
jgi:RNA polymerase sigma factor (sigma-70 family)